MLFEVARGCCVWVDGLDIVWVGSRPFVSVENFCKLPESGSVPGRLFPLRIFCNLPEGLCMYPSSLWTLSFVCFSW